MVVPDVGQICGWLYMIDLLVIVVVVLFGLIGFSLEAKPNSPLVDEQVAKHDYKMLIKDLIIEIK